MKSPSLVSRASFLLVGALVVSSPLLSANPRKEMRDVVTNEQLQKKTDKNAKANPLARMKIKDPKNLPDPTKVKPKDLLKTSDFLSFSGFTTLIPKRALLHVPKRYQARMKFERGTKLVIWPQFYRGNRGWIKTLEVTHAQARGIEPFDEKVAENLQKSSVVVVATYKGGPISVLPYTDPEEEAEKEKQRLKDEGLQNADKEGNAGPAEKKPNS